MAFAPTNIALCKYWGKRDLELNLPMTSSLSIALPSKGAHTTLVLRESPIDKIILNGNEIQENSGFYRRCISYLDLFRPAATWRLLIDIQMNIPVAAGLASSACGFASLTAALADLFDWQLDKSQLSILARLGSGSASRSFWKGFVEWHAGKSADGSDSFSEPLTQQWPGLCVGIIPLSDAEKAVSSRAAMQRTVETSLLYEKWPQKVAEDMVSLKQAIMTQNFELLGATTESNAMTMHATMLSSWPPICYYLPETIAAMQRVWQMREAGYSVYFTQDAGPNLKLLFLQNQQTEIKTIFPNAEVIAVF
jgi:diphosphomevalonate decarboxylase